MSGLTFLCLYCPASFKEFGLLVKHYEDRHGSNAKLATDRLTYNGADSGCIEATQHLGHQSSCLSCPFRKCLREEAGFGLSRMVKRNRNEDIRKKQAKGSGVKELAEEFGVCVRTIQRTLVGVK